MHQNIKGGGEKLEIREFGKLYCGGHFTSYLTHPAREGKKLSSDLSFCRLRLERPHWHHIIEVDGHTKILWDEENSE